MLTAPSARRSGRHDLIRAPLARRAAAARAVMFGVWSAALLAQVAGAAPTFTHDVEPILYDHCVNCHRSGGMPLALALDTFESAQQAAAAIKKQVLSHAMPPWPADSAHSAKFRNDPTLTRQQIDTLVAWVDAGAPQGNPADLTMRPHLTAGWQHPDGRPPDAVVSLPTMTIAAVGEIPYLQMRVKVPFHEDRWISGMQVLPGNGALVHHMGIAEVKLGDNIKPEDVPRLEAIADKLGMHSDALLNSRPAVLDPEDPSAYDMMDAYTPGLAYESFGDGTARLLKGGDNLYVNFNVHYTTTGRQESDHSRLGLWFQPQPPIHQIIRTPFPGKTLLASGVQLLPDDPGTKAEGSDVAIPPIPPYAGDYEVVGVTAFTKPTTLFSFQPHAHLRAKDFLYVVVYPDGHADTVLSVPKYDFHWQLTYELATPLRLPAGSKLIVAAHYDNSLANAHLREASATDVTGNCGPEKLARFRDQNQVWDEMFSPIVQYAVDTSERPKSAPAAKLTPLPVVEAVGCLTHQASGWLLTRAAKTRATETQSTTHAEVAAATPIPLGGDEHALLGAGVFRPAEYRDNRVVVKGVLIGDAKRGALNLTSLQRAGGRCE